MSASHEAQVARQDAVHGDVTAGPSLLKADGDATSPLPPGRGVEASKVRVMSGARRSGGHPAGVQLSVGSLVSCRRRQGKQVLAGGPTGPLPAARALPLLAAALDRGHALDDGQVCEVRKRWDSVEQHPLTLGPSRPGGAVERPDLPERVRVSRPLPSDRRTRPVRQTMDDHPAPRSPARSGRVQAGQREVLLAVTGAAGSPAADAWSLCGLGGREPRRSKGLQVIHRKHQHFAKLPPSDSKSQAKRRNITRLEEEA